ncbi:MAG TPA: protein kinase domain-containing protein [Elainellaceae cyanobacterium]
MSLCINPRCLQPDHPGNDSNRYCQSCGSELVLQDKYRVMRLLSDKSGFGMVYEAYERSTPKILKVLKETYSSHPKVLELFRKEAIVLGKLQHASIPHIEQDGYFQYLPRNAGESLHCIVMEKIDGPNLKEWMRQQGNHPIGEKQALNWLTQLSEILHLIHQDNYFHRDIKPENVMLRSTGQIVLVDFGAAREMTYTYLAQLGSTEGITRISSAGYTPPEQEYGQAVPQSDFYALGCTFIFLLTGKQPTDDGIYDPIHNELNWRQYAPHISPQFADFIDQLTAPRAGDRPHDTQDVLDQLAHLSSQQLARAASQKHPRDRQTAVHPDTQIQPTGAMQRSVSRWLWAGGVAVLVAGLGIYSIQQLRSGNSFTESTNEIAPSTSGAIEDINVVQTLSGHTGLINALVAAPDRETLISGSEDTTIKLWNLRTGEEVRTLTGHGGPIQALAVNSNGKILASGSADNTIKLWNLETGAAIRTLTGHTSFLNDVDFTPDGTTLVSASADKTIKLWDIATGDNIRTLTGHDSFVNDVAISPDGQTLISGSADNIIITWNIATGDILHILSGHTGPVNSVVVALDGQTAFSGSADKTIKVWNLRAGEELGTLTGHDNFVNDLAMSFDGKTLISTSADETIKLWDWSQRRLDRTLVGYGSYINFVVVIPEGSKSLLMATGSWSQDIKVWHVDF